MTTYSRGFLHKRRKSANSDIYIWQAVIIVTEDDGSHRQMSKRTDIECTPPKPEERGKRQKPIGKGAKRALDFLNEWRDELIAAAAASPSFHPASVDLNVAEYVDRYFDTLSVEPGTLEGYRAYLPRISRLNMPIAELTPTHVQHWIDQLKAEGTGSSILRKTYDQLRYACRWGVTMRELPTNPCDGVKPPKRTETMPNPLAIEDVPGLVDKLNAIRPFEPVLADAALLSLNTGMRRGEVAGLRFRDIYDDSIHINHVVAKKSGGSYLKNYPKNRERRVVPLNDTLREIVERRKQAAGIEGDALGDCFVFASPESPLQFPSLDVLSRKFTAFSKAHVLLGVEDELLTFHDLRDTFATIALTSGIDLVTVAAILGHKDTTTTLRHYAHFLPSKNIDAMHKMGNLLGGTAA